MCGYVDLIQNQFRTIMSSYDSEEEVAFEEDEVLWAKIRGYPWWPAFVDKVQLHPKKQEAQYTVFFFGDNTQYFSAKLGSSKLRKFIEFYTEFFPKAKTNRRLMISIQLAEDKLKQNDQEVEIFQQLRNSLKSKKHKPLDLIRVNSAKSEPNVMQVEEAPPQLIKSKTNLSSKRKGKKEQKDPAMDLEEDSSEGEGGMERRSSKRKSASQEQEKILERAKKVVTEQIFEEQAEEEQQPIKEPRERRKAIIKNAPKEVQQSPQAKRSDKHSEESVEQDKSEDYDYGGRRQRRRISSKAASGPRRRGRPKKINNEVEEDLFNRDNSRATTNIKKSKPIRKVQVEEKEQTSNIVLNPANQKIIKGVEQLLGNREELVSYLESIKITPQNAKQILDLNVSNILQAGNVNDRIRNILNLLKSALLLRYFPEDIKQNKSYQKLVKKKPNQIPAENLKIEKSMEFSQSSADAEIRKKTLVKLQKFLKKHPESSSDAKSIAVKMQSYFFKKDNEVGNRYKTIAYNILSSLKDSKEGYKEVLQQLEAQGLND